MHAKLRLSIRRFVDARNSFQMAPSESEHLRATAQAFISRFLDVSLSSQAQFRARAESAAAKARSTLELERWIARAEADSTDTLFLRRFEEASLSELEWDHYALIRAVYLLLSGRGRQNGRDSILQGIELNDRKQGRQFNVTNAYFWIQVVHFAICSTQKSTVEEVSDAASSSSTSLAYLETMLRDSDSETAAILFDAQSMVSTTPSDWSFIEGLEPSTSPDTSAAIINHDEVRVATPAVAPGPNAETTSLDSDTSPNLQFINFIQQNPYLLTADLWMGYYSHARMMSAKACARMTLPDKKRLPNLVGRDVLGV
ncbi:hypothetical protein C8F01DRAFT_1136369 [Mycena amicta]|nr:hypothetical protein C8F01DRAFT_1136369 [Mycena amicta]